MEQQENQEVKQSNEIVPQEVSPTPEVVKERNYTENYKWWDNLEVKLNLEKAFAMGCSDREACIYAGITVDQLYYYTREVNPEFQARKEELKELPILKAKATITASLDMPEHAKWYLERKRKKEFASRTELTGEGGEALFHLREADKQKLDNILEGEKVESEPTTTESDISTEQATDNTAETEKPELLGTQDTNIGN